MTINVNKVKIIVTIPIENVEKVGDAICKAGAGIIGNYTHCSMSTKCIGTFEIDCNGKKVVCEHFLIDYNSNDQYPFHDLKIAKDGSINEIIKPLNYDLIFIGHEHNAFTVDNKLYDVGSSFLDKLLNKTFNISIKNY